MRFIARFAMRGPYHAAAAAALIQLASPAVGFLMVFSGAVIALVTLRRGSREGIRVMIMATTLVVLLRFLLTGQTLPMLVLCLVVWLPAWLLASNLARTEQQAYPLMMIAVLVAAYALAIRGAVGNMGEFWEQRLTQLFQQLTQAGSSGLTSEQIALVAAQIHIWTLVVMFSMLAAVVLLARWWQSSLFNPGGFGREFRQLRLPRRLLYLAALVAMVSVAQALSGADVELAGDAFVIVVVLFAFQGLAVIHSRMHSRGLSSGWLVGLYASLVFVPQLVGPVLATTGVADGVADFRQLRAQPTEPPQD